MKYTVYESPLYVSWNYTHKCNFNCSHCYSRSNSDLKELTTDQYRKIADYLAKSKVHQVSLGGGESLVRDDCVNMIAYMSKLGLKVTLSTNGWYVDRKVALNLKEAGLTSLNVSLDHTNPTVHDKFRNKSGSFQRVYQCVKACNEVDLNVRLLTVITKINFDVLQEVVELADKWGAKGVTFLRFRSEGKGKAIFQNLDLNNFQHTILLERIRKIKANFPDTRLNYSAEPIEGLDSGCTCGKLSLALRPNGDISPCVYNPTVIGNILKDDLLDVWANSEILINMRNNFSCQAL